MLKNELLEQNQGINFFPPSIALAHSPCREEVGMTAKESSRLVAEEPASCP